MDHKTEWTDERVEQGVGTLLRVGVLIAAAITLAGGSLYLLHHAYTPANFHTFSGVPDALDSVSGILRGVAQLDSQAIIQLGLLALIATPIARVALSLLGFIRQRDNTYIFITTTVLAILLLGLSGIVRVH